MKSSVRDVMTRTVVTVRDAAPFKEVVGKLAGYRVSALPVIGPEGGVVGVVSEADLMLREERVPGEKRHRIEGRRRRRERAKMRGKVAADLMSTPALTIGPEASIAQAARLMHQNRVKRLPVVDTAGRIVGIVSRRDVLGVFLRPDEEIRDEIIHRVIQRILWIDPDTVHVQVSQGVVTLEGQVERKGTIALVEEFVEGVEGVVALESRLTFRADPSEPRSQAWEPWAGLARGFR